MINIEKIKTYFQIAALLSVFIFFGISSFVSYKSLSIIKGLDNDVSEAHRILLESGLTAREARLASSEERKYLNETLPVITNKFIENLDSTNRVLISLNSSLLSLNDNQRIITKNVSDALSQTTSTIHDIQPVLDETTKTIHDIQPVLSSTNQAVVDLDGLVNDQNTKDILVNINKGTLKIAETADSTSATMKDIQGEVHRYTHPTILVKIVNWTTSASSALFGALGYIF